MDYKITRLAALEKEIAVAFSAEEVKNSFNEAFLHLSKTVSINGFRKGRIPLHIVKSFYGKNVKEETERRFISEGIQEVVSKEKLKLATSPALFDKEPIKEDEPFEFKFRVEIFPQIDVEIKPYEHEYTPLKFDESMLERELEAIKEKFKEYRESDDEGAEEKDRLLISFSGAIGDEKIEEAEGKDVALILGGKQFLPNFENALYGRKKGDCFTTEVAFPADYKSKKLAGQTALFTIDITKVEKCLKAPELTDEFLAGKAGYPDTLEELKTQVRKNIEQYISDAVVQGKKNIAADLYVKEYDFEIPPTLFNDEKNIRIADYKKRRGNEELSADKLAMIENDTKYAIKRYIILEFLAEKLDIRATEKEIDASFTQDAVYCGLPPEYGKQLRQYCDEKGLDMKKRSIIEDKVLDKMVEKITFIEKPAPDKDESRQETETQKIETAQN